MKADDKVRKVLIKLEKLLSETKKSASNYHEMVLKILLEDQD